MLFILNKSHEVVGSLNSNGDLSRITTYFDDAYVQDLGTGAETFTFSTMADTDQAQYLVAGNFIAFKDNGEFKLFNIIQIEESHEEVFTKTVYCEMAGVELINEIIRPMKVLNSSLRKFLTTILEGTEWQLGKMDASFTQTHDFNVTDYKSAYELIQEYAVGIYKAEISYRVEIENGRIIGKYIDCYAERGNADGFRFAYGSNLTSVTRTVDMSNLATALIGVGKDNLTFKEVDVADKPYGQDFIANEKAYEQWNINGSHIFGTHKEDTESPQELLRLTRLALAERANPQIKYEMSVELLGREVEIGDTVNVVDHEFNPPLYLTARVNQLTRSKTDPSKDEVVLANFREVSSNITEEMRNLASQLEGYVDSQFPIGGDKIQDGAIGKEQFSKQYHTEIVADAVYASKIETEELIADKATIGDLEVTNAKIENLVATKADIEDLKVTNANIENLTANKADVIELNAVKADIGILTAGKADIGMLDSVKADIEVLEAGYAKIEDLDVNKANIDDLKATNAIIENLKVDVANIDELVATKADIEDLKVTNANIESLQAKDVQIENLVATKADIGQLDATNANIGTLTANVAQIDKLVAKKADIADLNVTNATIENLQASHADLQVLVANKASIQDLKATNANISNLQATKADITQLNATNANIGNLQADVADIENILAGNITADNIASGTITSDKIQTGAITAGSGIIADGAIGSAQISSLDASKITAGTVDTSKVTIQGSNGHLRIKGNRLQVFNGTGNQAKERVSVGDVNGDGTVYGLRVRGADGTTVLLDENGVTSEGITDGSISNAKISDDANIDGAKLNINSVVSKLNEDGTEVIKGTKIEVDGTSLTTKLSTITNKQTQQGEQITQNSASIKANEDAIKLKVDNQTYQSDKQNTQTSLNKHTSEINLLKDEVSLKVDRTGIEEIIDEVSGELIDSKIDTAKAEIKATTDKISQNVTNLTNTVSNKADGSTVTTLSNKVGTLETSVNGISGKVTNLEKTTTTLGTNVSNAQNTANSNKTNITNLQGEVNTVKSDIASLEVTTSGISQKVSNVESTTATLTTQVNTANTQATTNKNNITSLTTTVNNTNNKVSSLETNLNSITSRVSATETTTSSLTTQMNNKEDVNNRVIYAKGNGNDAPSNSIVKVGSSTLVSGHGRGLNIVALNPTTLAQYYKGTFDTYGGDNYRTQFAEKIQELNNGNYIIVVTSHDSACLNYATVCNALYLIGGSAPSTSISSYREAYALIGKSKLGKGNGLEMYIPRTADDARVAEVSVKVSEQGALLGVNSNNSESKIDTLTTRVSTAESKLTKDSLTTTIGSHYTTSSDVNGILTSKGYATTSEVKQTTDALTASFQSSGGYNILRNSSGKNGVNHWVNSNLTSFTSNTDATQSNIALTSAKARLSLGNSTTSEKFAYSHRFELSANKTYTISGKCYVGDGSVGLDAYLLISNSITATGNSSVSTYDTAVGCVTVNTYTGKWVEFSKTYKTGSTAKTGVIRLDHNGTSTDGTSKNVYFADLMVTEGDMKLAWSPHPSEVYDGITKIDKDGIKVSQSNYSGYTQMKADGFYVNNGSENVISVTSSGATFKGKVNIQSGSTVPTSTLSGTISSGQLASTITSDISTAKTNASTALSTANTANTTANSAKTTATTAQNTANTANTNATTALNTANSVNTTVNNGKTNWNNAYNRVNEWAYGAVTGSTTIDGGYIQANTIVADKIALGDFTNYAQLNESTASALGFTKQSNEVGGAWFQRNSMARDIFISKSHTCNGGESFRIKFDISTTIQGNSTSGGTDSSYRGTAIGLYCYNGQGASVGIVYSTRYSNTSVSGSSSVVTIPASARTFRVFVQTESYGNWSGTLKLRNVQVTKMSSGELIVDGSITAGKIASSAVTTDKLNAQAVTADKIKTGSITATQIASNTITANQLATGSVTADEIASGAVTATKIASRTITADRIASGAITANEIASSAITADKIASSSITSSKIASGAITANMITSGTMSANRITGGTLKSSNGNMYFDMDNGYMILYNNGTKVGQTLMNSLSGTSIYGLTNGCEYPSYSCLATKTSSSASTYTMMLSVAGQDLTSYVKYGVNLGATFTSHGNNFNLHNTYLCFGLGASSYSNVGQIRWYSGASNWSWIGITNSNYIGLFGQGGFRLGARVSSSNTSYFGADATADGYNCKAHIWNNLNMHNWSIRYCQGVSTASLEINEEIPFARSASSDGEEGEILTNSYNVVKTKQNIVETMGSVTITEDMVDKEVYIELDAYMAYKNYMVILSPVGEDRKVCVLRKEDDGFYIKGNKGEVDYIIKYECIDIARYRNSTGEDAPENIVEEKENEPKPIILEQ